MNIAQSQGEAERENGIKAQLAEKDEGRPNRKRLEVSAT